MKTLEQVKQKWEECINEITKHAGVIDHFKVNPPTSEHDINSLIFSRNTFAHLSAWLQALEFVMNKTF